MAITTARSTLSLSGEGAVALPRLADTRPVGNGGTLTIDLKSDPDTLDPSLTQTLVARTVFASMSECRGGRPLAVTTACSTLSPPGEGLYDVGRDNEFVPQPAASMPRISGSTSVPRISRSTRACSRPMSRPPRWTSRSTHPSSTSSRTSSGTASFGCPFITHDLAAVEYLADRIAVMHLGRFLEQVPAADLFAAPKHPDTQALLSAAPVPDPAEQHGRSRIGLGGDPPSPSTHRRAATSR